MSEDAYWCMKVPYGVLGCLHVSEGAYWGVRVPSVV